MPVVASVDYPAKRIYLSVDTVDAVLDTMDVYKEVRALRRLTDEHQKYRPIIVAGGNVEKITETTFTQPYVQLLHGCRIVPFNAVHKIKVIRDTFTDDGLAGRDCFDRSSLAVNVDVDVDVQAVEVRIVEAGGPGGGLTLAEIEASAVLAKEATARKAADAAALAAALSA